MVAHGSAQLQGRQCNHRGACATNAAALPSPRLHRVGFGVGREDGRLQPKAVQLACDIT